jgi:hypothetical protein
MGRHTETLEEFVVYIALYFDENFGNETIRMRPKSMFFENVEYEGQIVPRFKKISNLMGKRPTNDPSFSSSIVIGNSDFPVDSDGNPFNQ